MLGALPEFRLTAAAGERAGQTLDAAELRGRVWLASYIDPADARCDALGAALGEVQKRTRNLGDAWRLVSFVVGPAGPAEVGRFAAAHHANPFRWLFVSPAAPVEAAIERAMYQAGVLAPLPTLAARPVHGPHLVALIDRQGRLRGFYDVFSPAGINAVLDDLGLLANLDENP